MIAKTFEVRDRGTFIPVLAIKLEPGNEADRYLLARAGYTRDPATQARYVVCWRLTGGNASYVPDGWGMDTRTMPLAHCYIEKNFDTLESGAVVDVEFINGESDAPKASESEIWRG